MSLATARRDIEKRLDANWATTVIAWDNVNFIPPDAAAGNSWIRLSILDGEAIRMNLGNPGIHRQTGLITIEIFAPLSEGTDTVRGYADTIASIFRDKQFNGITCREASPENLGENNGWYQMNINIPFFWDGTYTV